jgi:lysophospholipase L1-like esterase
MRHAYQGICRSYMNYQKIVCWGDSQTFGARSYGCYPLYLAKILNTETRYVWHAINFSTNGHAVRDLWFRLAVELATLRDIYQACILIGTNDVSNGSELELFEEYYRQVMTALRLHGLRVVYCGEIPPIWADGHAFFPRNTIARREDYNARVRKVVDGSGIGRFVTLPDLDSSCYADPVHLNEKGNATIARAFADAIIRY